MSLLLAQAEDARFAAPEWLGWAWALPVAAAILIASRLIARRRLKRLAEPALLREIVKAPPLWRSILRSTLLLASVLGLIIALARPQWNAQERTLTREGRDVVFVVDVSRSMLAEDLKPNRLERVRYWIRDMVDGIEGDRVGLVAFSGGSVIKCPLTLDYTFFAMAVNELGPGTVGRGGTMIGDALRRAINEVFDKSEGRFRDIILITDGEDQDSFPVEAAQLARQNKIRIIALGVGSEVGARIPISDDSGSGGYIRYQGQDVRSRLESEQLARIAMNSHRGVYLKVGAGNIDLEQVYKDLIGAAQGSAIEDATVIEYQEMFQWFIGAALALLCLEGLISAVRK